MEPAARRVFDRCMRIASTLLACVLLASCGGGGGGESSEAQQVRSTVDGWLSSLAAGTKKGDNGRACAYLTRGLQKAMDVQLRTRGEHATCETYAANWTGRSTPPGRVGAHVTGVAVAGRTARVSLAAPPDRTSDVQLLKIDGRWRIDNY
jgi:hypothetical protein